jgi:hypothetical protein
MEPDTTIYTIIGVLLVGFIVLVVLKGIIKMLLLGAALLGAIIAYYWMSKNGYSYLSFLTSNPQEWMVTGLSWGSAIFILAVFTNGMMWFGNILTPGRMLGTGGLKGIVTTVLMVGVLAWVGVLGVFYYGSVADIKRAHQFALNQTDPKQEVGTSWMYNWKQSLLSKASTSWLSQLDPMTDPERTSLAKLVAYLSTFDTTQAAVKYAEVAPYIPRPRRLWTLSRDAGIRTLVDRQDMATLMNHPELTKFLNDAGSREAIARFPIDKFIEISKSALSQLPILNRAPRAAEAPEVLNPTSPDTRAVNPISRPTKMER